MRNTNPLRLSALVALAFVLLGSVHALRAAEFSLGAGVAASTSPYKSQDASLSAAPLVTYDSDRLYLRGTEAGVYIWKNEQHAIGAGVEYSWMNYDPDDSDDAGMKKLDKRRSTLMAGLSYSYTGAWGMIRAGLARDILGKSDGYVAEASYRLPIVREKLTVLPGAGVSWKSGKEADYYFGVSRGESARSGIKRYEAGAAVLPFVSVEAKYTITERWSAVAALKAELLTGSIKDSPMVGRSATVSGAIGAQFTF